MLQMPSSDLSLKEFEQLTLCENELLKTIMSSEEGIKLLKVLSNSKQSIEWLQQNGML